MSYYRCVCVFLDCEFIDLEIHFKILKLLIYLFDFSQILKVCHGACHWRAQYVIKRCFVIQYINDHHKITNLLLERNLFMIMKCWND
jgi:hypothetical protein